MMAKTGDPLTRQRVLEAALQLIERDGLEGFSMRKLGAMLGVEAMSLYNHVENKRALFDGVIELLIVQAPYPEQPDATPREELWVFAHAFRDVLRAHPRTLPLVATSPLRTPATLALLERLLETVHRANVTGVQAIYALQSIVGFTIGKTLLDVGVTSVAGLEPGPNGPTVWQQFPAEHYPTLHALLPDIAQWNPDREFDFGLQALFQSLF
ncbi:TetR/AcrR family transcriptional regulator [Ktedonobacter racemifer]|uniref:Transcriptional regulator, TetR family n=1 Tax=Ktedonobacter racemifer DSM 44963 TaxID=485913 RepID=D6TYW3_KTERA|nr:TetR/AcrR family transcriptional regulator C-terminal domain-containing protein [Ktedonobacter racemifer]EFH85188.1 transcriptional regulator, TetR family [Ktedonobacter racemifer DSM 44963]